MLILTRKNNESVAIGGPHGFERMVKLTVLRVSGGSVKLGFEVSDDVAIHRWEVWERIRDGILPPGSVLKDGTSGAPL